MVDPLDSNIISLVLAWIIAVPIFLGVIAFAFSPLAAFFEHEPDSPRWLPWFAMYYLLCLVVISPLRHIILQFLLMETYAVQSVSAFFYSLTAGSYLVFVCLAIYFPSIALPHLVLLPLLKKSSNLATLVAAALLPFAFALGSALFFLLLPYAAWTIHWLPAKDVIRAVNGPATVYYQLAIEPDIPRIGPKLDIPDGATAKQRLRSHVLTTYVSPFKQTKRHFGDSLRYIHQANEILHKQQGFIVTISKSDLKEILAAYKASSNEAQKVDTDLLNEYVDGLGTIYRDKFIPGLQALIKGIEDSDTGADLRGQLLLNQWVSWYNEKLDAIWDAL